ncbi:MAG: DUF3795 domain-containing protein [Actinomycetia bacterium]|nr:DUF3795 domain-containing protein [Actinomycetes bacterium]
MIKKDDIFKIVAPCGLLCYTCDGLEGGIINETAKKLLFLLESYESVVKTYSKSTPVLTKYDNFKEVLEHFANVNCKGCREGKCNNSDCIVPTCIKEKNINFCFECAEFPCEKTGFDDKLKDKWIRKNLKIKKIGFEKYFEEEKAKAHYST